MIDGDRLRALATPQRALDLGKAAEHLVCADLILQGHKAYLSDQGLSYDLVVDTGERLVRLQIKATCFARNSNMTGRAERIVYRFSVRRFGKGGQNRLSRIDCDIVALVALDIRAIAYLTIEEVGSTCDLMKPGFVFKGNYKRNRLVTIDDMPFERALAKSFP